MNIDRRFLNINMSVMGIVNEPPASPAPIKGTQYIVGSSGTGVFSNADANDIARYNGTSWTFTKPKIGQLEVLNLETLEILTWNGSAWTALARFKSAIEDATGKPAIITVNDTALTGTILPELSEAESTGSDDTRRHKVFINTDTDTGYSIEYDGTEVDGYIWKELTETTSSKKYLGSDKKIYTINTDGTIAETPLTHGDIIFITPLDNDNHLDEGKMFIYNANYYDEDTEEEGVLILINGAGSEDTSSELYIGTYTLTASDITTKTFTLPSKPLTINNANPVLLSVGGVMQTYGVDFTVTHVGNAANQENEVWLIRWIDLGLADIDLVAGDVVTIMYQLDPVQPESL